MAQYTSHPANTRGHADHGWLNARHSFSFANYYDPSRIHFGVLRVLNDDTVAAGMGFGMHPHDNMEIVTIILDGKLRHRDSMGHEATMEAGEVQVMSAGTGVKHSEINPDHAHPLSLFQIWIFPQSRNIEPRYDQRDFSKTRTPGELQLLVGPDDQQHEGLSIHQQAWISRVDLAGGPFEYKLKDPAHGLYLLCIEGACEVGGHALGRRDALGIQDAATVIVEAQGDTQLLLLEIPMR